MREGLLSCAEKARKKERVPAISMAEGVPLPLTLLLGIHLAQTLQVALRAPNDKAYQQQASHHHQQKFYPCTKQLVVDFALVQDVQKYPVRLATYRRIE